MDLVKNVNGKLLRCGYTTGTCATAAAKACAVMLLSKEIINKITLTIPAKVEFTLDIFDINYSENYVSAAIQKDSGDDPDITNGAFIYASVKKSISGIYIDGGEGVGRVTKPGLDQSVGSAAINTTPRKMITKELKNVAIKYGYSGGFYVVISVPNGKNLAEKTFNPKMGIEGGISIIGSTGIVLPMSHVAISKTIKLTLHQLKLKETDYVLLVPGNYGENFVRYELKLPSDNLVSCSNYIGEAISYATELGFKKILLVGHIGKLVKLGIGITNTHSAFGDGRIETLIAIALEAGADIKLLKNISNCVTTDAVLSLLHKENLLKETMDILGKRIQDTLKRLVPPDIDIGFVCFTNDENFGKILTCKGLDYDSLCGSGTGSS